MIRPALTLAAGAAVVVGLVVAAPDSVMPPTAVSLARTVSVDAATVVCPAPLGGPETTSRIAVARPFEATGQGEVTQRVLGGEPGRDAVGAPRSVVTTDTTAPSKPLVFTATGSAAPGFAVSQTTRSGTGELRGWSGTPCTESGTDFWFVGTGSRDGRHGLLFLSNPEASEAQLDLTIYRRSGVLETGASTQLVVPPGEQRTVRVDELAPDQPFLAVHVRVRTGRVAAALRDSEQFGTTPRGADWLAPSVAPTRSLLIPGVPGRLGSRYLRVVAPGDAATVTIKLITAERTFTPVGLDAVSVPAAGIAEVDLEPYAQGQPIGVALLADAPVTAGVMSRVGSGTTLLELAHSPAVLPLTGPAIVPDVRDADPVESSLDLCAPDGDATVRVDLLVAPGQAQPASQTVEVPGGTAVSVPLRATSRVPSFGIVVTPLPGSGPVSGVRTISEVGGRGPLLTTSPLVSAQTTVAVPAVVPDITVGLRRAG